MRFISKSTNLLIVLKPGLSAQPITGTPARPTVSVRFRDGVADVPEGELLDLMMIHPGYDADFILAEVGKLDPYAGNRVPSEPAHVMTEIKFGNTVGRKVSPSAPVLSPEMYALVGELANKLAAERVSQVLPNMVEEAVAKAMAASKPVTNSVLPSTPAPVKKGGRPAKKPNPIFGGEERTVSDIS